MADEKHPRYTLTMNTSTGGVPWTYNFRYDSDEEAIAFCKRHLIRADNLPRSCMSIVLWRVEEGKETRLARFRVGEPVVEAETF